MEKVKYCLQNQAAIYKPLFSASTAFCRQLINGRILSDLFIFILYDFFE